MKDLRAISEKTGDCFDFSFFHRVIERVVWLAYCIVAIGGTEFMKFVVVVASGVGN